MAIATYLLSAYLLTARAHDLALERQQLVLRLQVIDKDRQIASVQYDLGRKLLEANADKATADLSRQAAPLVERLRQLLNVATDVPFDWATFTFTREKAK